MRLAGPGRRFGGYWLDMLLTLLTLGIGWLIWCAIVMSNGQTPAKQMLGMRVIRMDGATAGWGLMFGRGFCKFLVGCIPFGSVISFFIMMGDADNRSIHDKMVNTMVVLND